MKHITLSLLTILCLSSLHAQQAENYQKVFLPRADAIPLLVQNGVAADHFFTTEHGGVELILSNQELDILTELGIDHNVLVEDMSTYYRQILASASSRSNTGCDLENFDTGEMGDYHSYADMVAHINQMQENYPDLVQVFEAGRSVEDRIIYAVKISDNVSVDETAAEAVVYYDALTHAREPMGLETVLYFQWWLLENYGSDAEATYLINNRELFFIPIVNPDGYVYNQTTSPNGGGLWRKNRSEQADDCIGVDLNRNYSVEWANPQGSSSLPCTDLYHGPSAFSEPETQAVRNLTDSIQPATAFSCHTYSDVFLCSNGHNDELDRFDIYSEYASEFSPPTYRGYGNWVNMIYYYGAGTTHDFLNAQGSVAYTPEIGHEFWEPSAVICSRVQEMLPAMQYMAWAAGDFSRIQDIEFPNGKTLEFAHIISFYVRVKNRGMSLDAEDVRVEVSSDHIALTPVATERDYGTIAPRSFATNDNLPFEFLVNQPVLLNEPVTIKVAVFQGEMLTDEQEIVLFGGEREVLFSDDAETPNSNWGSSGNNWGRTQLDAVSGQSAYADSPLRNYEGAITGLLFRMTSSVDLSEAEDPWLAFNAKWSFDADGDYVEPLVSTNNGVNWQSLEGIYTTTQQGQERYINTQHWVAERISLSDFIGEQEVKIGFRITTNSGRQSDGFYFDDFEIVNYAEQDSVIINVDQLTKDAIEFEVYPNPVRGQLSISSSSNYHGQLNVRLLDGMARPVMTKFFDQNEPRRNFNIELTDIPAGLYYLELTSEAGVLGFHKVVVKK